MPVRSAIDICSRSIALQGLDHTGIVSPGLVAPIDRGVALARDAVKAHQMYLQEVRHAVEVSASEEAHLVAWLSKRLDAPLRAPNLDGQGYRFVGVRLLPASDPGPTAQFMYEA